MMSQYDQQVYDAGFKYVPQSKFLLNPFQIPQGGGPDASKPDFGLPTLNIGGGGSGAAYTGGITGLTTDFQKAIDARTQRLEKAYNEPSTAKIFGFPAFRQDVNPVDAGEYLAAGERIPFERTGLGKMFQPQSPREIMEQGYEPRTNIGVLSAILGKADKFGTLPRADQAFITSQMGYTGPTVFGENTSGLSKDPFGLNTRSAFGNYAERVGKEVTSLEKALAKARGKYDTEEEFLNMTKLMRKKLDFYRQKVKERDELRRQDEARLDAERKTAAKREKDFAAKGMSDPSDTSRQGAYGRRPGSGGTVDRVTSGPGRNVDQTGQAYDSGGREGFGYGLADGGRVYYMDGGLADLVDIYD